MAKYSKAFKLQIVKEYLDGDLGYSALAQKYKIRHKKSIQEQVRQYKQHGKKDQKEKKSKDMTRSNQSQVTETLTREQLLEK